ncbi:MAG: hypothetical protein PHY43_02505 [Verrucomicrobiales bacterium]|nr:hypothetical protein [Verrucomicrobiales bacterium]
MTLDQAHKIAEIATDAFASKPRNNFCARSKLCGHSFLEISRAFALVIAGRRQIAGDDQELKTECAKLADSAGALIASLDMMVVPDEQFELLARFTDNTPERQRVMLEIIHNQKNNADEEKELEKEETPLSFNSFCWTLNYQDPLFWQKIYTHLDLPYDESCPRGQPKQGPSDGQKSFFFPNLFCKYSFESLKKCREQRRSVIIFLLVIAALVVWFGLYGH